MSFVPHFSIAGLAAAFCISVALAPSSVHASEGLSVAEVLKLKGSASIGKRVAKKKKCVACHGDNGLGKTDTHPNLAGQHVHYLVRQLVSFSNDDAAKSSRTREHDEMMRYASKLKPQELVDVAAYYSALDCHDGREKGEPSIAKPPLAGRCESCHGVKGKRPLNTSTPRLAGQHAPYLENQIIAFQQNANKAEAESDDRKRSHHLMNRQVARLSPDQVRAIAVYFSTRLCQ